MFTVAKEARFTRTVTVMVPVNGGHENQTVGVTYRVVPTDQLSNEVGAAAQIEDCRKIVVSMDDLIDEQKSPVEYNNEIRDQLLNVPYVRNAIVTEYLAATGKVKSGN